MHVCPLLRLIAAGRAAARAIRRWLLAATRPASALLFVGILADVARRTPVLIAENAFLGSNSSSWSGAASAHASRPSTGRSSCCWPAASAPGGTPC